MWSILHMRVIPQFVKLFNASLMRPECLLIFFYLCSNQNLESQSQYHWCSFPSCILDPALTLQIAHSDSAAAQLCKSNWSVVRFPHNKHPFSTAELQGVSCRDSDCSRLYGKLNFNEVWKGLFLETGRPLAKIQSTITINLENNKQATTQTIFQQPQTYLQYVSDPFQKPL